MVNYLFCHPIGQYPSVPVKPDRKDKAFPSLSNAKQFSNTESPDLATVWVIDIQQYLSRVPEFKTILSQEEKQRAERFYRQADTTAFIIRRAILRILLATEQQCRPEDIRFIKGLNGKPILAQNEKIGFNCSHSSDLAVIVVANQQTGIDLEFMKPDIDYSSVAEYAFSEIEYTALQQSADPLTDFFSIWTRKEAFLKATGTGLDDNIHLLNCLDGRQNIPAGLNNRNENWELWTIPLQQNYMLSIAARQSASPLNFQVLDFEEQLFPVNKI